MKLIIDIRAEWEIRGLVGPTLSDVYIIDARIRGRSTQFMVQSCNWICNFVR